LSEYAEAVAAAFGGDGELVRSQTGFRPRTSQQQLGVAIADAITGCDCLIAEAGTGTGKTFAYLVPALLAGGQVLVSTGTKTLQDQLLARDLPAVSRALGLNPQVAVLKGRANYVCRHHLARNLVDGRFERREDVALLRRIERFAAITATGDRAEAVGVAEDAPVWSMATSTRENCLGQECPQWSECFVVRARQAAQRAEVVIVNHHLFCADLALRDEGVAELLPNAQAVIFDEAHQLPGVATRFFGAALSSRQLIEWARDLRRVGWADARDAADWMALADGIERAVRELRLEAGAPGRLDHERVARMPGFGRALAVVQEMVAAAQAATAISEERSSDLQRLHQRARELASALEAWIKAVIDPGAGDREGADAAADDTASGNEATMKFEAVRWVEVMSGAVILHATPLSVAGPFRRHLAAGPRAWIFVSATLSVAGRFDHFQQALGLEQARTARWESPFDYEHNALLYVPSGCGEPAGAGFAAALAAEIWPLLVANRGRAFVLCTSLRMVDRIAELLADRVGANGGDIELLVQGSAARPELLARFRAAPAPVLIGSASFWEGVDVVGAQLSLLVIDKLPFAPPDDPVIQARIAAARREGRDPFRDHQLPEAATSLQQGAGRLIRSETDRGVLVVGDERLATRSYGRRLIASLPPFRRTRDREEVLAFINSALEPGSGTEDRSLAEPAEG